MPFQHNLVYKFCFSNFMGVFKCLRIFRHCATWTLSRTWQLPFKFFLNILFLPAKYQCRNCSALIINQSIILSFLNTQDSWCPMKKWMAICHLRLGHILSNKTVVRIILFFFFLPFPPLDFAFLHIPKPTPAHYLYSSISSFMCKEILVVPPQEDSKFDSFA